MNPLFSAKEAGHYVLLSIIAPLRRLHDRSIFQALVIECLFKKSGVLVVDQLLDFLAPALIQSIARPGTASLFF